MRKIIHVDMDAFFASVEERDNPVLKGLPVAVGYDGRRGVVATANYAARRFGVHSALAASTAKRLCPQLIFIAPRFEVYRAVSKQVQLVYSEVTDLIEPVSLDEAYLDVTTNKQQVTSAWALARTIRNHIFERTGLTASAGVSYNKFLAKLASDMRKPNGQYLITPEQGADFVAQLPIAKFHGIGPATTAKMRQLGITTGADLRVWSAEDLQRHFGKVGLWYHAIAQGIDDRPVEPHRERKSVSAETTFYDDVTDLAELRQKLDELAGEVWAWLTANKRSGRTVVLKVKWADFSQSTRSRTEQAAITELADLRSAAAALLDSVLPLGQGVRLIGIGVAGFATKQPKPSLQTRLPLD